MKKGMLLLLLLSSVFAHAQSLKEALYGGKLKSQPGTVIRKGDDLTPKVDTTLKVATTDTAITKAPAVAVDSSTNRLSMQSDSAVASTAENKDTIAAATATAAPEEAAGAAEPAAAPKDNNAAWKAYINAFTTTLKSEVLPSKKIKSGTYYVLLSYVIDTDGQVLISDVSLTPENAFLQQQIKERLVLDAPRLTPVLSSSGTARKVSKKYNFTLSKQ